MVIILFGPNAVGKSTVGRQLAGRMQRAAYVEADLLKYFVAGGLVAWSAGLRPRQHPEEYRVQIELMTKNTALLAGNFGAYGFDCVIEGLDLSEGPGSGWAEENLAGHDVRYIAVVCNADIALQRLKERDGITRDGSEYTNWLETAARKESGFDYVMDTSTVAVHDCVTACAKALNIDVVDSAAAMGVEWDIVQHQGKIDASRT
ncbi:MAG: AAA family ATPase [Candidatus Latescibacteria bacterium]|nr:AAA family ATPase [Candidatus Latescibacterota bacterium]